MSKSKTTDISGFADAISELLSEYGEEVKTALDETVEQTAQDLAKDINKRAKGLFGGTGKYGRSWRSSDNPQASRLSVSKVVHANENGYRLAHLLEKGHALRRGGRVIGDVKGREHIAPATEAALENVRRVLEQKLR